MKRVGVSVKIVLGLLAASLAGCGNDNLADLRQYTSEVKARPKTPIAPLPEFKPQQPFLYAATNLRAPFTPPPDEPLTTNENGIRPDPNRVKEALEAYPLDGLRMVGTVERAGTAWSLVMAPDGIVYRVQPNNYMGQNDGRVVKISDEAIELIELIEDGQGGWIERPAALALSEDPAGGQ